MACKQQRNRGFEIFCQLCVLCLLPNITAFAMPIDPELTTDCPSIKDCSTLDVWRTADAGCEYECGGTSANTTARVYVVFDKEVAVSCPKGENVASVHNILDQFRPNLIGQLEWTFWFCDVPTVPLRDVFAFEAKSLTFTFDVDSENGEGRRVRANLFAGQMVTKISFRKFGLSEVPRGLFAPVEATLLHIDLSGNRLRALPEGLFDRTIQLKVLKLSGNRLSRLPVPLGNLPELERLHLQTNQLTNINGLFLNVSNLSFLDLQDNRLATISPDAFHFLPRLQEIRLFANQLKRLPGRLFADNPNLRYVDLRDNPSLTELPGDLFHGAETVEHVDLSRCNLTSFPKETFQNLSSLETLYLQYNSLANIDERAFDGSHGVVLLRLDRNRLTQLHASLLVEQRRLAELNLNGNRLRALPHVFTTLCDLQHLDVGGNRLEVADFEFCMNSKVEYLNFSSNVLTDMPHYSWPTTLVGLQRLDLSGNRIERVSATDLQYGQATIDLERNAIERIDVDVLRFASTTHNTNRPFVRLKDNPLCCDCNAYSLRQYVDDQTLHRNVRFNLNIDDLVCASPPELNRTMLTSIPVADLVCNFTYGCPSPCQCFENGNKTVVGIECVRRNLSDVPYVSPTGATLLNLTGNKLTTLNSLNVTTWSNLTILDLSHNNLTTVDVSLPPNLTHLYLHGNQLRKLSDITLTMLSALPLKLLTLYNNPWTCECDDVHFRDWLEESTSFIDPSSLTCDNDAKSLVRRFRCDDRRLFVAVVVSAVLAILLILASIAYLKHQHEVRVWLYSKGWCVGILTADEIDADKEFDAFVSFSQEDVEWVSNELVPELESKEPRYNLCIHSRDWLVGEWITDQIVRSVEASCRTIVVLSQNFLKSVWGRMEFKMAHQQALKDRTNRLIVVVLGEVPAKEDMDPDMRMYVGLNTYLRWGDPWFWKKLRYAMPHRTKERVRTRTHRWATPFPKMPEMTLTTKL